VVRLTQARGLTFRFDRLWNNFEAGCRIASIHGKWLRWKYKYKHSLSYAPFQYILPARLEPSIMERRGYYLSPLLLRLNSRGYDS
jgi:hypothetical protein